MLLELLAGLSASLHRVALARVIFGFDTQELANEQGITTRAVRSQFRRIAADAQLIRPKRKSRNSLKVERAPKLVPGLKITNSLRLGQRLNQGGCGTVWQLVDRKGRSLECVAKLVPRKLGRAEKKVLLAKDWQHPNLAEAIAISRFHNYIVIRMERGKLSLRDCLRVAIECGLRGIPERILLGYMFAAASGLDFLHHELPEKGLVVHRDVKPDNLMLFPDGLKVIDFGLAQVSTSIAQLPGEGMTWQYAPPEFREDSADGRSDQYSLAITYAELRDGTSQCKDDFSQAFQGVLNIERFPRWEGQVLRRATAAHSGDRYPTCTDFVSALESAIEMDDCRHSPYYTSPEERTYKTAISRALTGKPSGHKKTAPRPNAFLEQNPATASKTPTQ